MTTPHLKRLARLPSRREIKKIRRFFSLKNARDYPFGDRETRVASGKIDAHTITVRSIALNIGRQLRKRGYEVDLGLLESGALLHDMLKHKSLVDKKKPHGLRAASYLRVWGYPELARLVARHDSRTLLDHPDNLTLEEKIIMYADARSASGYIQTLGERRDTLINRYPHNRHDIHDSFVKLADIEREFQQMGLDTKIGLTPKEKIMVWFKRRGWFSV